MTILADLAKNGASPAGILVGAGGKYLGGDDQKFHAAAAFALIPCYAIQGSARHGVVVGTEAATDFIAIHEGWLAKRRLPADSLAIILVKGDSMEPDLKDGDLILIDRAQVEPRTIGEGHIHAVQFDSDLFVKRVRKLPNDRVQLPSSNPLYPPITVKGCDLDGVTIIGRVIYSTHEW